MIVDVTLRAVKCENCGDTSSPTWNDHDARMIARKMGWDTSEERTLCQDCKKTGRKAK